VLERTGELTHRSRALTLLGETVQIGQQAPDASLRGPDQSAVSLSDYAGKVLLISVVPSLDTGICDAQTRRFNEEAANFADDVVVLTISAEHPWNQRRWCGAAGIDRVVVLSDHYDLDFGHKFGTAIKEYRLLQRSIFVIGRDGKISYVEYVPEIAQHPDYDGALAAVRAVS
jgi:thiol peroxidase